MFDVVSESFRKATETSVQVQMELFKKWVQMWPGVPNGAPVFGGEYAQKIQQFQQQSAETVKNLMQRQRDAVEASFKLGLQNIEKAFQIGEVKTVDEMRTRMVEMWQKCFDSLRQICEIPMTEFQAATEKWIKLMTKPAA
jgi:hypothetical protein